MQETKVLSLGWDDPLEKEMGRTSILLPGKSHGQRILVGYSSWGEKRIGHKLATNNTQQEYLPFEVIVRIKSAYTLRTMMTHSTYPINYIYCYHFS